MNKKFSIQSSDPALLEKAVEIAHKFVEPYLNDQMVGIVFLGAIARGYFDHSADVDIALIKKQTSEVSLTNKFFQVEGVEVHVWLSDYEEELVTPWDMSKRWTFSQGWIYYDPAGKVAQLLANKVPLKPEERKWLLMSGLALSEWYINRLTDLWVERGSLVSAHHMFDQGINYFFDMLFGLNHELVPDMKWRYYCAEKLEQLPGGFQQSLQETMTLYAFSIEELDRRKRAFMEMWEKTKPVIEQEVNLTYDEIVQLV